MKQELWDIETIPSDEAEASVPRWKRIARTLGALLGILLLLYLFGGSNAFFFRRTRESVIQEPLPPVVSGETLTVPLSVFVFGGTERSDADVMRLVQNADAVWRQANITLPLSDVRFLPTNDEERFIQNPLSYVQEITMPQNSVAVFLTRTLVGLNGVAFVQFSAVAIAEYTTRYDYRTFAHEIGHILGLSHVADQSLLMSSGGFGVVITADEATNARETAASFAHIEP